MAISRLPLSDQPGNPPVRKTPLPRALLGAGIGAVCIGLTALLWGWTQPSPYLVPLMGVLVAATLAGGTAGLTAALISGLGVTLLQLPPLYALGILTSAYDFQFAHFFLFSVAVSALGSVLHRTRSSRAAELDHVEDVLAALEGEAIFWEADPATLRFTDVRGQVDPSLGLPPEHWIREGAAFWERHLHPDDRAHALALLRTAAHGGAAPAVPGRRATEALKFEHRLGTLDGQARWFRTAVHLRAPAGGAPARLCGLSIDVTGLRSLAAQLGDARELGRALLESTEHAICRLDLNGRIVEANAAAASFLGLEREELVGRDFHELAHSESAEGKRVVRSDCPLLNAIRTGVRYVSDHELLQGLPTGHALLSLDARIIAEPLRSSDGTLAGAIVAFRANGANVAPLAGAA